MKNIRKGIDLKKTTDKKVDCGNFGVCCKSNDGYCCRSEE